MTREQTEMTQAEIELRAELEQAKTELFEQCRINGMGAEREAKLMAQLEQSRVENEMLRGLLLEAANEIADWGAYADSYFQHKHDLAGAISKFRQAATQTTPTQGDV